MNQEEDREELSENKSKLQHENKDINSINPIERCDLFPNIDAIQANKKHEMLFKKPKIPKNNEDNFMCVVGSTKGKDAPIFQFINTDLIQIKWANYRGYRSSPFLPTPNRLKKAIQKWKEELKKPPKVIDEEEQGNGNCYICHQRYSGKPKSHIDSEMHQENLKNIDWGEFNEIKKELDNEFIRFLASKDIEQNPK